MIQTLLIATGNRHKVEEIRQILADLHISVARFLCLKDLPGYVAPEAAVYKRQNLLTSRDM